MFRIFCLIIGYFIGCISMGFIVSKLMKTDLRQKGSGNLGTTNALRVLGFKAGAATFLGDILKSMFAFFICTMLFAEYGYLAGIYACAGAILGHDFPFYLKFKGGKGIAATIGMILCVGISASPWLMVITFGVGILVVLLTNYISAASMLFSIAIPITCFVLKLHPEAVAVTLCLCVLAIFLHRKNIERLMVGNENKFTLRKTQE